MAVAVHLFFRVTGVLLFRRDPNSGFSPDDLGVLRLYYNSEWLLNTRRMGNLYIKRGENNLSRLAIFGSYVL